MKKVGFTIGKFAPFHKGHEYLIETALKDVDDFYVVIYDTPQFNIDIETKEKWVKEKFPKVKIIKAYDSPKQFGLDEESVNIQMKYLENELKGIPVTHFYSSEEYGKCVADYLNIQNVVVDERRKKYNICASNIRDDAEKYKKYIDENVYIDIKKGKKS